MESLGQGEPMASRGLPSRGIGVKELNVSLSHYLIRIFLNKEYGF